MAVYSVRIESDAEWCTVELRSAALWARAPGRELHYVASGAPIAAAHISIDDRTVRLSQRAIAGGQLAVLLQVATSDDSVSLQTEKDSTGEVRVYSAANMRLNDKHEPTRNMMVMLLYLDAAVARAAGVATGDSALA